MNKFIETKSFIGLLISFLFLFFCCLYSNSLEKKSDYEQWFVGSVLTPLAITLDPAHPSLECVLATSNTYGVYSSSGKVTKIPHIHSFIPYFDFQCGFNKRFGVEIIGSLTLNSCGQEHATHLQDSIVRFGLQISNDKKDSWIPDFRLLIQETFPTGKYRHLNPDKKGCDLTGQGAFQTGLLFASQKLFQRESSHPFLLKLSAGYFICSSVRVKGFNYYGGDANTLGTVYRGNYFSCFLFGEYALTRKCALACECNYQKGSKGHFVKERGPRIETPAFSQLCFIPEIQYTFTSNIGIVVGYWFTAKGKNSSAFRAFFLSTLYIF